MIEVRQATDADRGGVVALLARVFGRRHADNVDALWDWRWQRDPRLPEPGCRGAVAVTGDRIVGTLSFLPAAIHCHGRPVGGTWAVDAAVDAGLVREALRRGTATEARSGPRPAGTGRGGLFATMMNHPVGGPAVMAKSISDPAMAVMRRIGFREAPHGGFFARDLAVRGRLSAKLGATGAVIALLPDLVLGRLPKTPEGIRPLDGPFDDAFDEFWQEIATGYAAIGRRDAAVLNWRYRQQPLNDYAVLADRRGGRLRGYVVFRCFETRGWRRGRIVDLVTNRGDAETACGLVAAALSALKRRGADRVDLYLAGGEGIAKDLRRLGFGMRSKPTPLLVRWPELVPALFVTAGDGDGG